MSARRRDAASSTPDLTTGVVVIGRNEGERLKRCLRSVQPAADLVVYVDSGSTDGSVAFARSIGVEVVDLDMERPFTMARGRNAGLSWLKEHARGWTTSSSSMGIAR